MFVQLESKCCLYLSGVLMSEIVDCFVVCHWALSHEKLTEMSLDT